MNNLDKLQKSKEKFLKIQNQKSVYLGEYKERVIAALKKDQIMEDDVYEEIINAINNNKAYILKMSRDIKLHKLKPYIDAAEKASLKYQLVDGISYVGDIGLVVASKEALENEPDEVVIRDMDQDFIDAGLGEIFSKNRGKKICKDHYEEVEEVLPQYIDEFKKINLWDKFLGIKCVICKEKKKKN